MHRKSRPSTSALFAVLCCLVLVCLALVLLLCSCQGRTGGRKASGKDTLSVAAKRAGNNGDAIPVEASPVSRRTVRSYVSATSTLEALSTAQLLAETTGRVTGIYSEEGDRVKKGAVLMKLEDTQERLDVEKAGIDLDVAERDWQRAQELAKRNILSAKEFDETRLKLEAAKHAKARAEYQLGLTRILAPFPGILTERKVQLGETVTPGKHVATVAEFDPLVVRFHVPESEDRTRTKRAIRYHRDTFRIQRHPLCKNCVGESNNRPGNRDCETDGLSQESWA